MFWMVIAIGAFWLLGCNGSDVDEIISLNGDGGQPKPPKPPGTLGTLLDIGDLMEPQGDHWYFTRVSAISDQGIVVGASNAGPRGDLVAFRWEPPDGPMELLGLCSDLPFSEAIDINSSGVIVGNCFEKRQCPEKKTRAFIWDPATTPRFKELTPGSYSEVADINEEGEVLLTIADEGDLCDEDGGYHAYYFKGALSIPLCRIVGKSSSAVAINEHLISTMNSGGTALFMDLNYGKCESINFLPGATKTRAVDINDSQHLNADGLPDPHIIGNSGSGSLDIQDDTSVMGFFWDGGAMYSIGHLGGGTSQVTDMNNKDQVVGAATMPDGSYHAIIWTLGADKKGQIQDLGTLGGKNSFATAVNEAGQVVGWSETGAYCQGQGLERVPVRHAFLWDKGTMYDLGVHNDFYVYPFVEPYPFSEAVDINASGQITGNSITINSHYRGFFLSPVVP